MGYLTKYILDYEVEEDKVHKLKCDKCGSNTKKLSTLEYVEHLLRSSDFCGYSPLIDFVNGNAERCKWYEWEQDMRRLSKKVPTVLFTLDGRGEEDGDIWVAYFKGGKAQVEHPEIKIPPFDKKKLM